MSWLLLVGLGMMWVAFLLPTRKASSPTGSVKEFERNMDLLADTEHHGQGRWIVTPRKGMALVGPRARAQLRARERRRRVLVFLLECIALTSLMGVVPPLRVMWYGAGAFVALLGLYAWMLGSIKHRNEASRARRMGAHTTAPTSAPQRYVSEGRLTRQVFNGLGALGADDSATIVVRRGRQVGVARV